jgi:hypothetical protein
MEGLWIVKVFESSEVLVWQLNAKSELKREVYMLRSDRSLVWEGELKTTVEAHDPQDLDNLVTSSVEDLEDSSGKLIKLRSELERALERCMVYVNHTREPKRDSSTIHHLRLRSLEWLRCFKCFGSPRKENRKKNGKFTLVKRSVI